MSENKYQFEHLTPNVNVELGIYEDAINYVFQNSDIKNVAISGSYSSGKSSILESYKSKNDKKKFLHISLAHFNVQDSTISQNNVNSREKSTLEGKILNQLIHQISEKNIPQTNFKLKTNFSLRNIVLSTIRVCLIIFAILYFVFFDKFYECISNLPDNELKEILSLLIHPYNFFIIYGVIIILLFFYIYQLVKIQKNKNVFRKLSLQGNEIEIFEYDEASYFDKYLNEVIYLFENCEADVVVFEDMDRYDIGVIFERLREINILINAHRKKTKDPKSKPLRFFYLLRDDIFLSKDRTKFFDYIIPVVPVIDSSNSYDQLVYLLKRCDLIDKFGSNFLRGISLYIDDMRILKNVYNEFLIYYNKLKEVDLDYNKMFAVIVYKNLFPRDFSDLQLKKGFVYTVFKKKAMFIEEERNILQNQIEEKKHEIESMNTEWLKSIQELNTVYYSRYYRSIPNPNLNEDDVSNELNRTLNGDELEEYTYRKHIIENILNDRTCLINMEIENLEKEIVALENKKLCQIITHENIADIFGVNSVNEANEVNEFNEIKGSDYFELLKYLVGNGYIDENYSDYMTYFYANSISLSDKIFVRSILDRNSSKGYNYTIESPELVLTYLELSNFDQEEILNFDLFNYLLNTAFNHLLSTPVDIRYLKKFIYNLKTNKNVDFVKKFIELEVNTSICVKYLNEEWPEMFVYILDRGGFTEDLIHQYLILTLYNSNIDVIYNMDIDGKLRNYISSEYYFINIDNQKIAELINKLRMLDVCFATLDHVDSNRAFFEAVYSSSLYEINFENIYLVLKTYFGVDAIDKVLHQNYSQILMQPNSPLAQYVNNNLDKYLSVILEQCDGYIEDGEDIAIQLLNKNNLSNERKEQYLKVLRTKITSIKSINDESLWRLLLDNNNVLCSRVNILEYFILNNSIDLSLIHFINESSEFIMYSFDDDAYEDEIIAKFFNYLIKCNSIEHDKLSAMFNLFDYKYQRFNISGISNEQMTLLIRLRFIVMNLTNLRFMRANYEELVLSFILANTEDYVDIMTDGAFSKDELFKFLEHDILDELKIKLLNFTNDEITIINKNYSPALCKYILQNNLKETDIVELFESFEQWAVAVQEEILSLAVDRISMIIGDCNNVSSELKKQLLSCDKLDIEDKISLFIEMIYDMSFNDIKMYLENLSLTEFSKLFIRSKRPNIKIDDVNKKILIAFKERGLIENFDEVSNRNNYFKVTKNSQYCS